MWTTRLILVVLEPKVQRQPVKSRAERKMIEKQFGEVLRR